jgi:hypothetical protein
MLRSDIFPFTFYRLRLFHFHQCSTGPAYLLTSERPNCYRPTVQFQSIKAMQVGIGRALLFGTVPGITSAGNAFSLDFRSIDIILLVTKPIGTDVAL